MLFSNAQDGKNLLKLASFSIVFSVLNQTFTGILQGFQKNKVPVLASFFGTISKVMFNLIFVLGDCFYENGIIISTIISNILMFIILYKEVRKKIKFKFKRYILMILLAGIIMIFFMVSFNKIFIFLGFKRKISFIVSAFIGILMFFWQIFYICKNFGILIKNKN